MNGKLGYSYTKKKLNTSLSEDCGFSTSLANLHSQPAPKFESSIVVKNLDSRSQQSLGEDGDFYPKFVPQGMKTFSAISKARIFSASHKLSGPDDSEKVRQQQKEVYHQQKGGTSHWMPVESETHIEPPRNCNVSLQGCYSEPFISQPVNHAELDNDKQFLRSISQVIECSYNSVASKNTKQKDHSVSFKLQCKLEEAEEVSTSNARGEQEPNTVYPLDCPDDTILSKLG
ncbi:unnamed protein product [Protopolystoma xenopodis]|uniref:Uncharacterized protein n=1 Tax=Protopolystoma xenopodis TaxID=117903 RepID=A0A3S4ZHT2_9PLAT|nr:unnamed protein product [Protopolystoma xenopodis]